MRAGAAQRSVDGRYGTVLRLRRRGVVQRYARSRSTYKPVPRAMCRAQARVAGDAARTRDAGRARNGMQLCGTWSVTCGAIMLLRPAPARSARGGGVERARAVRISWSRGGWIMVMDGWKESVGFINSRSLADRFSLKGSTQSGSMQLMGRSKYLSDRPGE